MRYGGGSTTARSSRRPARVLLLLLLVSAMLGGATASASAATADCRPDAFASALARRSQATLMRMGLRPGSLPDTTSGTACGVGPAVKGPDRGAWLGAFASMRDGMSHEDSVAGLERLVGRPLKIVNTFHGWSSRTYRKERDHLAAGRVPMISWRATDDVPDPDRADAIRAGRHDALIAATADAVKALGGPVLIRWNWEMDQPPGERQYIGSPSSFVEAWKRIHTIFRDRGATNASFVWAPRAASFRKGTGPSYYPGDAYVDWIGASAVPIESFNTFEWLYSAFYGWAAGKGKPILIWAGTLEKPGDATWKGRWFSEAVTTIEQKMPKLRAFVYYHALAPKGGHYFVDTSPASLAAFRGLACRPFFHPPTACG